MSPALMLIALSACSQAGASSFERSVSLTVKNHSNDINFTVNYTCHPKVINGVKFHDTEFRSIVANKINTTEFTVFGNNAGNLFSNHLCVQGKSISTLPVAIKIYDSSKKRLDTFYIPSLSKEINNEAFIIESNNIHKKDSKKYKFRFLGVPTNDAIEFKYGNEYFSPSYYLLAVDQDLGPRREDFVDMLAKMTAEGGPGYRIGRACDILPFVKGGLDSSTLGGMRARCSRSVSDQERFLRTSREFPMFNQDERNWSASQHNWKNSTFFGGAPEVDFWQSAIEKINFEYDNGKWTEIKPAAELFYYFPESGTIFLPTFGFVRVGVQVNFEGTGKFRGTQ